jgi:hypothetical protein
VGVIAHGIGDVSHVFLGLVAQPGLRKTEFCLAF